MNAAAAVTSTPQQTATAAMTYSRPGSSPAKVAALAMPTEGAIIGLVGSVLGADQPDDRALGDH